MTMYLPILCNACALRRSPTSCDAFALIPRDILTEGADHRTPRSGDHGVVFQQDPAKKDEFETWKAYN